MGIQARRSTVSRPQLGANGTADLPKVMLKWESRRANHDRLKVVWKSPKACNCGKSLWFFLLGRINAPALRAQMVFGVRPVMLGIAGFALIMIGVVPGGPSIIILGWGLLALWGASFFIDMFRIPSWVHRFNMNLVDRM